VPLDCCFRSPGPDGLVACVAWLGARSNSGSYSQIQSHWSSPVAVGLSGPAGYVGAITKGSGATAHIRRSPRLACDPTRPVVGSLQTRDSNAISTAAVSKCSISHIHRLPRAVCYAGRYRISTAWPIRLWRPPGGLTRPAPSDLPGGSRAPPVPCGDCNSAATGPRYPRQATEFEGKERSARRRRWRHNCSVQYRRR
jgi:hypothetical protein